MPCGEGGWSWLSRGPLRCRGQRADGQVQLQPAVRPRQVRRQPLQPLKVRAVHGPVPEVCIRKSDALVHRRDQVGRIVKKLGNLDLAFC